MQEELAAEHPELGITLLAINEEGYESGLDAMAALGDVPLLQDNPSQAVWTNWKASWRDVIIVDDTGMAVYSFNLTSNDLSDPLNYAQLKSILIAVAEGHPPPPVAGR